ncbi:MAG TPA: permease [Terriglobia bacterium]|nr:permease [Terriglobia bacterium]
MKKVLVPLLIVCALFVYKANSSVKVLRSTWISGTIAARPEVVAFGQQVSAVNAVDRFVNYFAVIWPALAFGVLIGAAMRAFISPRWFAGFAIKKPVTAQLTAGLAGAPLMLCSCCVTPVFTSLAETSGRLGPALGLLLASPALNPAALALTFMLFDSRIAAVRLVLALTAVLLIGPLVEHLFREVRYERSHDEPVLDDPAEENAVSKFAKSLAAVSLRTVPALLVGVLVSMLMVQWLPTEFFTSPGARVAAILIAATLAVPLALPTFLEIPLSLSLLAAGFPAGAAVALLFAGPAINLPSLLSVARVSGWKVAVMVAFLVWILAAGGGLLVG